MTKKHLLFLPWLITLLFCPNFIFANRITDKLKLVQKQLVKITDSVQIKEIKKNKIEQQISFVNLQLSNYQKKIDKTKGLIQKNQAEVSNTKQQIQTKTTEIKGIKQQLATLLNRQYRYPLPNLLVVILQHSNPNDKARMLEYLKYIQTAKKKSWESLKVETQKLYALETSLQEKSRQLSLLMQQHNHLIHETVLKKNELIKLKQNIKISIGHDKQKIKLLRDSEIKLNQLIAQIARQQTAVKRNITGNLTQEDLALTESGHATIVESSESLVNSSFSRFKGALRLPVREGVIAQYYGQKKVDNNTIKGLLIQSAQNLPVFSVGGGKVVYTSTWQDYGKIVIVAHDGVYVTLYAGLSRINIAHDAQVTANTIIGTTGTTSTGESGLYFELRENLRPINPMPWFK